MYKLLIENEKDFVKEKTKYLLDEICIMFVNNSDIIYIFCFDNLLKEITEIFKVKSITELNEKDISKQLRSEVFRNSTFYGRFDFISTV